MKLADQLNGLRIDGQAQQDGSQSEMQPDASTRRQGACSTKAIQAVQRMLVRLFKAFLPCVHPADAVSICRTMLRAVAADGTTSLVFVAMARMHEVASAAFRDVRECPVVWPCLT